MVKTQTIELETNGNCHIVDITEKVNRQITAAGLRNGTVTIFNIGTTAGVTTIEFEPGLVNHDIASGYEKIAPQNARYEHEETWHDDNGHSHVRASMLGPSIVVPIVDGQMTLGTWQQVVLIDFDTRPRTRKIVCQIIGE